MDVCNLNFVCELSRVRLWPCTGWLVPLRGEPVCSVLALNGTGHLAPPTTLKKVPLLLEVATPNLFICVGLRRTGRLP